ncbi:MAG: 2,3-butanediol dehydrogenase [Corynebacterium sp.]|uniref:2,3-butanediol dehydrogenase n=1 Tax=Corynebacterium TaxID=1716 RepID=UPI002649ADC4|nr:2,3-butanediol dehydrogenase [Corynebacterium sp.]MDN5722451.1 2,3-butanediol dehydrogenase [Corynebacterium sp.]MDN6283922.1 2,3-butanediol dehydrogenase [Corynebacterium sp.]MDN6304227.1 2,3-butanediol dehydrogenase [Corynebacterium sp.]MDN6353377.1 2,3-butanediol dehydrogenase [Corynebacterium sp.]MDN6368321.1 2,3-butanediol dehydrogenase [Corynebacterium sp.]
MKAARYYGNKDIRVEDIDQQALEPGTVRINVAWCGICGTDLHEYLDGPIFCPTCEAAHPISGETAPITLGHEFSGVVAELGEGVDDLAVGDHVVVEPYIIGDDVDTGPDSTTYHLSENMNFIGLAGRGGGLSENVVVRRRWVHKIADSVPLDEAALIEPLSVGFHAVQRSGLTEENAAGKTAIIGGAGPIGLLTAAVLKAWGVRVVVSELSELRRQKALDSGVADLALNPAEVDVVDEVKALTDGAGADVAFECTSVQVVLDTLMDALRPTGVLVVVSIWGHRSDFDIHKLVMKEIDLRGTIGYVNSHPATIALVESGKIDLKPFITGKIGLDGLVDEGFDTLINRNETAVKILVSPSGEGL